MSVVVTDTSGFASNKATGVINVIGINDAPIINTVPGSQSVNEDASLVFSNANSNAIMVSDVDASNLQVTLTSTNGVMSLSVIAGLTFTAGDGTADATMTFSGTKAAINAALNGMNFTPTANFSGSAQIQIVTNDLGGNGTLERSQIRYDQFTVNAVNDAPVNTMPASYTTNEDTALSLTGISVSDADAASGTISVTVCYFCTLTATSGGSVTVTGSGSSTIVLSGTLAISIRS